MLVLGPVSDDGAFWRTHGLAQALEVNLTEAMAVGALDRRSYAAMVGRCDACPHGAACTKWLSAASATAEAAPEYCANARIFDFLKARL